MAAQMQLDTNPSQEDLDAVHNGLREYNVRQAGDSGRSKFALFVREESGKIIGGVTASMGFGWLHIDILWLSDSLRGGGWGSKLLKAAEDHGRETGCTNAWLDTFSFQAPGFYRKQGYSEYGRLTDFPPGHARYFFTKKL